MIKRLFEISLYFICMPLLFIAVPCVALTGLYSMARYIITGKEDDYGEIAFYPMEFVMWLPDKIIWTTNKN